MKLVIFGLSISSSWGNGHAALWRGLCRALGRRGHKVVFFEKDVPYYAAHRDLTQIPGVELHLYRDWDEVRPIAEKLLAGADVGLVTSFCPDGVKATELVMASSVRVKAFYDLDTPVTLEKWKKSGEVDYLGPRGLRDFDLVLSYTGGQAVDELKRLLGARKVRTLYGSVDPDVHRPHVSTTGGSEDSVDLSYLGTYAEDRQSKLVELFVKPSRRLSRMRFMLGGSMYPAEFPWGGNIFYKQHVSPPDHPMFYCSSRLTLNITRAAMAEMGYCPSGRLFEAAACGVPLLSDRWQGLDEFFDPGEEILVARNTEDVIEALTLSDLELERIARNAMERVLTSHTADVRVAELEEML